MNNNNNNSNDNNKGQAPHSKMLGSIKFQNKKNPCKRWMEYFSLIRGELRRRIYSWGVEIIFSGGSTPSPCHVIITIYSNIDLSLISIVDIDF